MGTRCLTHIKELDKDSETIAVIYRQCDGYVKAHGKELKELVGNTKIVNGWRPGQSAPLYANTMNCLAPQLIAKLKNGIGNIYLYSPTHANSFACIEYEYTLYVKNENESEIYIEVRHGSETVYDGLLKELDYEMLAKVA